MELPIWNFSYLEFILCSDFKAPTSLKMEAFTPRPYDDLDDGVTSCSPSSEEHLDDRVPNHTSELKRCQIGSFLFALKSFLLNVQL